VNPSAQGVPSSTIKVYKEVRINNIKMIISQCPDMAKGSTTNIVGMKISKFTWTKIKNRYYKIRTENIFYINELLNEFKNYTVSKN
jgi:hypothetical protein